MEDWQQLRLALDHLPLNIIQVALTTFKDAVDLEERRVDQLNSKSQAILGFVGVAVSITGSGALKFLEYLDRTPGWMSESARACGALTIFAAVVAGVKAWRALLVTKYASMTHSNIVRDDLANVLNVDADDGDEKKDGLRTYLGMLVIARAKMLRQYRATNDTRAIALESAQRAFLCIIVASSLGLVFAALASLP